VIRIFYTVAKRIKCQVLLGVARLIAELSGTETGGEKIPVYERA